MDKRLIFTAKVALIAACFTIIFSKIPLVSVVDALRRTDLGYMLAALVVTVSEPFFSAWKWQILLRRRGINVRLPSLAGIVYSSNFLAAALPTGLAVDAVRVLMMKQRQHSLIHSTGALLMDRILSIAALLGMALSGVAILWPTLADHRPLWGVLIVSALVGGALIVLLSPLPTILLGWGQALCPSLRTSNRWWSRGVEGIRKVHASLRAYHENPGTLFKVFSLNLVIQTARIIEMYLLFMAVGHPVAPLMAFAFIPIIVLLVLLPISYFGMGVKEGAFLYFFGQGGVPQPVCLSVSLLSYILVLLALLPGGVMVLISAMRKSRPAGV